MACWGDDAVGIAEEVDQTIGGCSRHTLCLCHCYDVARLELLVVRQLLVYLRLIRRQLYPLVGKRVFRFFCEPGVHTCRVVGERLHYGHGCGEVAVVAYHCALFGLEDASQVGHCGEAAQRGEHHGIAESAEGETVNEGFVFGAQHLVLVFEHLLKRGEEALLLVGTHHKLHGSAFSLLQGVV